MNHNPEEDWRVLLVDDDEEDYLLTRSMLSLAHGRRIELDWASTCQAGRQLLRSNHYHAALIDYDLGACTGIELIRETAAQGYPTALILYTGRGGYEVDLEAMLAGATLYLSKSEVTPLLLERSLRYAIERKRIEQELDRRLQERSDILESIQDGFFAIDRDWRITYINQRAAKNGGYEPEELMGRNIWEAFPRLQGTILEENYRRVMNERRPVQSEMRGVYQNQWYNISIYPSTEGISVYWQDISGPKQAEQALREANERLQAQSEELEVQAEELLAQTEELSSANERLRVSEERLRVANDAAGIGTYDMDLKTGLVRCSPEMCAILGIEPGRALRVEDIEAFVHPEDRERVSASLERSRDPAGEAVSHSEHRVLLPGGQVRWISWNGRTYFQDTPAGRSPVRQVGAVMDITPRKQAEEAVRRSQVDLARAQAVAQTGSWRLDVRQDELLWSDETHRMFGIPKGTRLTYETFLARVHPEDRDFVDRSWMAAIQGKPYDVEHRIIVGEEVKWVRERAELEFDRQGLLLGGFGTVQDITGRKQSEQALRQSEQRFRSVVESNMIGVVFADSLTGQVTDANDEYLRITGRSREELEAGELNWKAMTPADGLPREEHLAESTPPGGRVQPFEKETVRPDGNCIPVLIGGTFLDDERRQVVAFVLDITERKRAEQALRQSEEQYRSLFEGMTEGFAIHEVITDETGRPFDFRFLDINPAFERLTGLKREDVVGRTHNEVLPGNDPKWVRIYGEVAMTGEPVHFEDYSTALRRHYEVYAYRPAPRQFAVIFMDVTERKQTQEALSQRREELEAARAEAEKEKRRLEAVMEALPVGMAITDAQGGSVQTNSAYERVWGGPRPQPQSVSDYAAYQAWWAETGQPVAPQDWASAQAVQKGEMVVGQLLEIQRFDGSRGFVINSASPVRDSNGKVTGSAVAIQDITDLRMAEQALQTYTEQLRRSNETLEDFAFIASHDLREPLRKVQLFGDMLKNRYSQQVGDEGRDYITRMQQAAGRMQGMLDGLLDYSRVTTQGSPFAQVDLNQTITDVLSDLEMRTRQTGGRVEFERLPEIEADPVQIRQLLQNLIVNALKFHQPGVPPVVKVYASQRGMATKNVAGEKGNGDKERRRGEGEVNDPYSPIPYSPVFVEIRIEDNGIGFEEQYLAQLFQPFKRLNKKSEYEGSGMGLAICRKIAERHGGSISARSVPGTGSTFIVTLPCRR